MGQLTDSIYLQTIFKSSYFVKIYSHIEGVGRKINVLTRTTNTNTIRIQNNGFSLLFAIEIKMHEKHVTQIPVHGDWDNSSNGLPTQLN